MIVSPRKLRMKKFVKHILDAFAMRSCRTLRGATRPSDRPNAITQKKTEKGV